MRHLWFSFLLCTFGCMDMMQPAAPEAPGGKVGLVETDTTPVDNDGDGINNDVDCDDNDPSVHPYATEICDDGIDNDCDELIDAEDDDCAAAGTTGDTGTMPDVPTGDTATPPTDTGTEPVDTGEPCTDADGDGYCAEDDCNDADASAHVDEIWYYDGNQNGLGSASDPGMWSCGSLPDRVNNNLDCDDDSDGFTSDAAMCGGTDCDDGWEFTNPGAAEVCDDGSDNDCDGAVDNADADCSAPVDSDGDGYADVDDCSDYDPTVYPGAPEVCGDGIDQDCSGADEVCPATSQLCYEVVGASNLELWIEVWDGAGFFSAWEGNALATAAGSRVCGSFPETVGTFKVKVQVQVEIDHGIEWAGDVDWSGPVDDLCTPIWQGDLTLDGAPVSVTPQFWGGGTTQIACDGQGVDGWFSGL